MESREFTGIWECVEEDNGTYGNLSFSPSEGSELTNVNSLDSSDDQFQMMANASEGTASRHEIVKGRDVSGNPITLLDVVKNNTSLGWTNAGGMGGESTYRVSQIIVGEWFDQTPKFDYLKTKLPQLEEWARIVGVSQDMEVEESPENDFVKVKPGDKFKLSLEMPESIEADVGDFNVSLEATAHTEVEGIAEKTLRADLYLKIESDEPEELEALREKMRKVQNFISFGMMKTLQPTEIKAGWNEEERKDVEILRKINLDLIPEKLPHPHHMTFTMADISEDFEEILNKWFESYEELKPVFDLYFSTLYSPQMYVENKLMSIAHALESYFRKTEEATYLDDDWEDVYDDFVEFMHGDAQSLTPEDTELDNLQEKYNLDSDFRSHMKNGTLKYANEYSLRKMIKELTQEHEDILEGIRHNPIDKSGLIADTRNYLVHRTDELRESCAIDNKEQIKLTWGIRMLLEVCILRDLGINDEQIKERIGSRYENKRLS